MHHQDLSGDPPGSRRTASHYRRGSSGASASSAAGGSGVNPADDSPAQAGSSSPGLQHQPQSQAAGAQVKKKSGFQITSVTSAQINVSGNNSLADDTESYDDMDESHTEDLSSSDLLDVNVSRATDTGVPERSSSDETLNSLHGVDTPGLASPNEPLQPHSIHQGSQQHPSMVNGTMHHHHYYPPQQHSQAHHHHSDEPPALPAAPLASSSPAMASKAGPSMSQRTPVLDNTKPASGTNQPLGPIAGGTTTDAHLLGSINISNVTSAAAAAVPPPGSAGFDNTSVGGYVASGAGGTGPSAGAPNTQTQHAQTQTAPGSRFRVVKLDTNCEPFRKGRWTCTDYYEKEIPPPATSEAPKGAELAAETEAGPAGISPGMPAVQPPHTLQAYQQQSLDFTRPQAMLSPPQGLAQTTALTYVSPQEVVGGAHVAKPVATVILPTAMPQAGGSQPPPVIPQQLPYAVDPHQALHQEDYPTPQLLAGVMTKGSVRQPDFIRPTAPFQTQVTPPIQQGTPGAIPVPGVAAWPAAVSTTQQLPHQGQVAPSAPASFAAGQPQTLPSQTLPHPQPQVQHPSTATVPVAPTHGIPYMPLTALQADLQPLLTPGATFPHVPAGGSSMRSSHLEDAQRLLLQHQGLLGLPRRVVAAVGEGGSEASGAAGSLARMGMSAVASDFMAFQGEEDRLLQ
uniref:TSC22 domain family protein 1-like n=1 Tax=Scophthalmus maximus TaxID=52904 RepID=A0A8D3AYK9_SCOMX